jgi:hypothetical protein
MSVPEFYVLIGSKSHACFQIKIDSYLSHCKVVQIWLVLNSYSNWAGIVLLPAPPSPD